MILDPVSGSGTDQAYISSGFNLKCHSAVQRFTVKAAFTKQAVCRMRIAENKMVCGMRLKILSHIPAGGIIAIFLEEQDLLCQFLLHHTATKLNIML